MTRPYVRAARELARITAWMLVVILAGTPTLVVGCAIVGAPVYVLAAPTPAASSGIDAVMSSAGIGAALLALLALLGLVVRLRRGAA